MSAARAVLATAALALLLALTAVPGPPDAPAPRPAPQAVFPPLPDPGGGHEAARLRAGVPAGAYTRAVRAAGAVPPSPLTTLSPWRDRGPASPGGRITDLAWDRSREVLYVASASGGLWRADGDEPVLTPTWPQDATPAIGAVAVLADGTVLVGTGEANAGGGSTTFGGDGLHRSEDGGATWTPAGLEASGTIARIIAHPTDPDVAWVAAGGDLFLPGGQRGIYRTDDGGRTWDLVLPGATPTTGGADIALDPADPDHLLAATWDRQRTPSLRRYGGPGSGLHTSTDGGLTWRPVTAGLPGFSADAGRIAVSLSPADPRVAYAVVTRGDGRADGLYRSDDGGSTWRLVNDSPLYTASQHIFGWWFSKVFPAPEDPDRVLVPGLTLLESTDGGRSFAVDRHVHADHHALVWHPEDPAQAWLGSDAGLYHSRLGGRTGTWTAATDQPFTQAYDVAVPPTAPDRLAGGFQDVGCMATDGGPWAPAVGCGDGVVALPHPIREGEAIHCGQHARCWVTVDGRAATRLPLPDVGRAAWSAPLVRMPGDPDSLLLGAERLWASPDAGATWRPISGDLSRGRSPDPDYPYGTISEILPLEDTGRHILVGTDDGLVWRTADGGGAWERLLDADRWVTGLAAAAGGDVLVVGTSGFFAGEGTAQLRRSTDAGATWTDVAEGLPDAPVNDIRLACSAGGCSRDDPLVVATDVGVYTSWEWADAERPRWRRVGEDLPRVPAMALDHLPATGLLTVGTFGRGIWQTVLPELARHAGPDRYATAAAVGRATLGGRSAEVVVLASGAEPTDAVAAAAAVAARPGWALLLAGPRDLPPATAEALAALAPERLVVAGGPAAIADAVVGAARRAAGGVPAERVHGPDRYATAAVLATMQEVPADTVLLATAASPHDALAGAALAAATDGAVLLVDADRLPTPTAEALNALAPSRVIALGGTAAIPDGVLHAAATAAGDARAERIAGVDRVQTAARIALAAAATPGRRSGPVWLAGTQGAIDALTAGASGWPVLLADTDGIPPTTAAALRTLSPRAVWLAGGEGVLGSGVVDGLRWGALPVAG